MTGENCEQVEAAILGAGPAGICLAISLSKHEIDSLLIDHSAEPGGALACYLVRLV